MVRRILLAVMVMGCMGCARTRYVPVREESIRIRTDTVFRLIRDSSATATMLHEKELREIRDSIAPVLDSTGKVVAYDRWHWRTVQSGTQSDNNRWHNHTDTASSIRIGTDTEVKEAVAKMPASGDNEKKSGLRWWQKVLMALGAIKLIQIVRWVRINI